MLPWLLKRTVALVLTLFVIAVGSFALLRAAPGGPFDSERSLPPEVERELMRYYGLDRPAFFATDALSRGEVGNALIDTQFGRWLSGLLHGDLGPSFQYKGRRVQEVLAAGAPASAALGLLALGLAVGLGIGLGAWAAARRGGRADRFVLALTAAGIAVPNFVIGVLLASIFGVTLRLFPLGGWGSPLHLILPATALMVPHAAAIARLTRSSLLETLGKSFCRTARAKGLSETEVIVGHALRPALAPVVQYLGPATASLVTGSLAIEAIFNVPGMGAHFVNAALNRDYTMVMGTVIVYASLLLVLNALADLAAIVIDPRVRLQEDPFVSAATMLVQGVRVATRPALWRRVGPAGWLLAFLLAASLVGSLALESPDAQSLAQALNPPSVDHPFGTDLKGRDLLARDARGLLLSIRIGLAAALVASVLGVAVGLLAGYAGGRTDRTLMRAVDVMYGLPYIVFVVVLMVVFGRSELNLFLAIGLTSWLTMARIVRAEVRTVRALPYVEAARALGAGHLRIAALHVLPNVAGTALVYGALIVPAAIRQEALLSFLGLGVAPPAASLGSLLREGLSALSPLQNTAWLLWVPALTLLALVWALNGVADRLRDRLDPRKGR